MALTPWDYEGPCSLSEAFCPLPGALRAGVEGVQSRGPQESDGKARDPAGTPALHFLPRCPSCLADWMVEGLTPKEVRAWEPTPKPQRPPFLLPVLRKVEQAHPREGHL